MDTIAAGVAILGRICMKIKTCFFRRTIALLLAFAVLSGCGSRYQRPTVEAPASQYPPTLYYRYNKPETYIPPTNGYVPPVNEDGYIVVNEPESLLGVSGNTVESVIESFKRSGGSENEKIATRVEINEDGGIDFIFTLEQFIKYKDENYNRAIFRLSPEDRSWWSMPEMIKDVYYENIDEDGVPWTVILVVDKKDTAYENYDTDIYWGMLRICTCLGQYQLCCGIPNDAWAVHATVLDANTGDVIQERDITPEIPLTLD